MNHANRSKLAALFAVNALVAIIVWLVLYWRGCAFHIAGVYFTPGILVLAGMLLVDLLLVVLLSGE